VEFAQVGGVEVTRASDFMFSAMNIFGASANEAVDTLVAAANASPASIDTLVESFSQVGSAGANFGQSIFDVTQSLAVLARAGIVGEEAGTAVKTMLTKLVAPTDDAKEALASLGLTMADFRDKSGKMLPMQQIAGVFQTALQGMGDDPLAIMEGQRALVDVFEQRGIKVMAAFANAGVEGFKAVAAEMTSALPVSDQFLIMMSGMSGNLEKLNSSLERLSIAFGEAVAGPMTNATDMLRSMMEFVRKLVEDFPVLAVGAAAFAAAMITLGSALITASLAMRAFTIATIIQQAVSGPKGWLTLVAASAVGIAALGVMFRGVFADVDKDMEAAKKGIEEIKVAAEKGGNSTKPPQNREPLDPEVIARQESAKQLAAADKEFEEGQQQAVAKLQQMSNSIVDEVDKAITSLSERLEGDVGDLGDTVFDAGVQFQQGIAKIKEEVEKHILNPQAAATMADRLKDNFDAQLRLLDKAMEDAKPKPRDFGPSLGGFGNSIKEMGVGPKLAGAWADLGQIERNARMVQLASGRKDAMSGLAAAATPGSADATVASSVDRMLEQIAKQTKAVSDQTPLLKRIADGVAHGGLVFT